MTGERRRTQQTHTLTPGSRIEGPRSKDMVWNGHACTIRSCARCSAVARAVVPVVQSPAASRYSTSAAFPPRPTEENCWRPSAEAF